MPLLQLIILAIVQGITEFLPISSSAHLIVVPMVVPGWSDQGPLIDVAVHVGSLGAVMIYFRQETAQLFLGGIDTLRFADTQNRKLFLFISAATVPFLIAAPLLYFAGFVDAMRSPVVIGLASIFFGILLWISDRRPQDVTSSKELTWRSVIGIGLAQVLAIIPGTSRSGITITAGRYFGFSRPQAARFSMLLSIPTIMALGLFAGLELIDGSTRGSTGDAFTAAVLSFLSAYAAIYVFMKMTERMSFTPFVIYRCLFGLLLIVLAFSG